MAASWSGGYTGVGPNDALSFLDTEFGTTWDYWQDPFRYMDSLDDVSVFISRGTNDPFAPLTSYRLYEDALPNHQLLYIPNTGFGMGTPAQVTSWRALIQQSASGAGMHNVELSVVRNGGLGRNSGGAQACSWTAGECSDLPCGRSQRYR